MNKRTLQLWMGMTAALVVPAQARTATFVGHYGEVLEYAADYSVDARMHGDKEVVVFHPAKLGEHLPSDSIAPQDFAQKGLVELLVIPKKSAGLPPEKNSLRQLWQLKESSLDKIKAVYVSFPCEKGTGCPITGIDWPENTAMVEIKAPYKLWQIYSESPTEYYILTSGADFAKADWAGSLAWSLMETLRNKRPGSAPKEAKPSLIPDGYWMRLWLLAMVVLVGMMAFPSGEWRKRLRLVGAGAITFGHLYCAYALGVTFAAWTLGWGPLNNCLAVGLTGAILAPLAGGLGARLFKAKNPGSVALAALAAASPLLIFAFIARHDRPDDAATGSFFAYLIMFPAGMLIGSVFGATIRVKQTANES